MEDREVVGAVVAGDPDGIAEAYDRYAMPLYAYCRSLLREPADAADAVQDTFLIATAKLGRLKDPGKLRPWLYAVARNECLRRLRSGQATSALDEAADMPDTAADVAGAAELAELRGLVQAAIDGLNPGDRDVIELSLRHELQADDLADTLGVSRNHAHALLSRARGQLERCLGALLVARTGRDACAALGTVLDGWDGRLTVLMRKRVSRHIDQCEICGERKRRELSRALLAGAVPPAALLPGLREQVLRIATDRTPAGLAHRAAVTAHAGSFGPAGFPRPGCTPGASGWPHVLRHSHAVIAGTATATAAAGVSAVLFLGGSAHGSWPATGARGHAVPGAITDARGGPSRGPGDAPASGGRGPAAAVAGSGGTTGPGRAAVPGSSRTAPAATQPGSSPPASSSSPSAGQGVLTVSPSQVVLTVSGQPTGTFTLTASGGPVSYSISAPSGLTVSPASGSLASGASVQITVTSESLVALDDQLTVEPGGLSVTVLLNISL